MKRIARRAYAGGIWVLAAAVVAQFLLAGLGIFADGGFLTWHATAGAAVISGSPCSWCSSAGWAGCEGAGCGSPRGSPGW